MCWRCFGLIKTSVLLDANFHIYGFCLVYDFPCCALESKEAIFGQSYYGLITIYLCTFPFWRVEAWLQAIKYLYFRERESIRSAIYAIFRVRGRELTTSCLEALLSLDYVIIDLLYNLFSGILCSQLISVRRNVAAIR